MIARCFCWFRVYTGLFRAPSSARKAGDRVDEASGWILCGLFSPEPEAPNRIPQLKAVRTLLLGPCRMQFLHGFCENKTLI